MARRVGGSVVPLVAAMLLGFATLVVGSLMTGGHEAGASFPSCGTVILSGSSWLGGNGVNVYSNGGDEGTGVSCGGTSTVNGMPTQAGSFTFSVKVNGSGESARATLSLVVGKNKQMRLRKFLNRVSV